jgi:hypothetical protein
MSRENIETTRRRFGLWNRAMARDDATWRTAMQEMVDQYHPDAELDYRQTLPDFAPTRGTEAIFAWTEGAREAFGGVRLEPKDYIDAGESIVVPVRIVARVRRAGPKLRPTSSTCFAFAVNESSRVIPATRHRHPPAWYQSGTITG